MKFPVFDFDYQSSLIKNLNFYNSQISSKFLRPFINDDLKDVDGVKSVPDWLFSNYGAIVHMKSRGIVIEEYSELRNKVIQKINEYKLQKIVDEPVQEEQKQVKVDNYSHVASVLDGLMDDFIHDKKPFNVQAYISSNNVDKNSASKLKEAYLILKKELISTDEQLIEAWEYLGKVYKKKVIEKIDELIVAFNSLIQTSKISARKAKPKSPLMTVSKVQYMQEDKSLGIKSIHPSKLVNCQECWIYNVKLRRLFHYVKLPDVMITVKGTTLVGFDEDRSSGKIIRNPEKYFSELNNATTKKYVQMYSDIKATESKATGRLNTDSIILKVN